ncbi:uncharacterized protein LOC106136276 [Amyelois transitella]|uniref:uncharacterized protein LOC106136276 n=1 Tax=Amyelois transitella TaxID=680683 RepID=UPI002990790C|nr:uncharacterized protein LOC106136276 [Amyelois transitella]
MHIQEGTNTTLTTCTKMTEEVDRRHGVNGNSGGTSTGEDVAAQGSAVNATGGRLKFFKDGKFILELVRGCAREGERAGWVSVPRKTFWPPAAPPAAPPPAAALSVSDDNSSVQSSPWQRDHCWKQAAPRRHLSRELVMYYCRPAALSNAAIDSASRRKRRRPYDTTHLDALVNGARRPLTNGVCDKRNGDVASPESKPKSEDAVDGVVSKPRADDDPWADYDREKYYHMKLKKPYQYRKLRVYKKTRSAIRRKELTRAIDKLREKIAALPVPVNAKLANCRQQEHMMVSPRKRILRELERVSLEDQSGKRRAKTVPALSTAAYPVSPGPSQPPRAQNGAPRRDAPVSKNVSSYSIHSLLSMPDDAPARRSPEAKRSPLSHPPSLKTESPSSVTSPDLSPSPDGYRYRYAALAGSPGASAVRESPPPELRYRYATPRWAGPYRETFAYPYGYLPPLYRAPAPLWLPYPPPGPWPPLAHPLLANHIPKDEPTSDLPLNLSKH